ncbi:class I SAM-dependent methyltransferase [candidate division KSB1 bacterium]|nr:class I SAM-dependent methyltransferase [candidate division KSB1 bacterium]
MSLFSRIQDYVENSKKIRNSFNNPLKKIENLHKKDKLEKEFYDIEAQKYLENFDQELFLYQPDEEMPASHHFFYSQLNDIRNKRILDIGCGYGFTSVVLAKRGAIVTSIDVSPKMIELTRHNAQFNDVVDKIEATVMSAQALKFRDDTFDYVVGLGILHHLNLDLAGKEISRVLKPGGKALFIEPRIPFKFLIFVRSVFPNKCFESPGGSQLTDRDMDRFFSWFSYRQIEYFMFLKKFTRFNCVKKNDKKLEEIDSKIIKKLPWMKKFYWAFVVQVIK